MNLKKYFGPKAFYASALSLAIPVMLQALVQNLVSLIDNFMVAGLGDIKMSGINVTNQVLFVLFVAFNILAAAGGMFMSQFNGAKNAEGMAHAYRFKIITMGTLALGMMVLGALIPDQLLGLLLQTNTERAGITAEGVTYLSIIIFTFLPITVSVAIGSSLRETGQVRPALIISVIAALLNTLLNWIFIYGNLGAPRLEVAGAAWATFIARLVEMTLFILWSRKHRPAFFVGLRGIFAVNLPLFFTMLTKSGILLVSDLSWVLTETIMTAIFNGRGGSEIVSGMAGAWAIANLFFLVFGAIHTSVGVIVGGTLGKNDLETARIQARWLRTGALCIGVIVSIGEFLSVLLIPIVFGNLSENARAISHNMLWIIALYMPVWTYLNAQFATARAGGDAIMGAWVDGAVNLVFFLPGIFMLSAWTSLGPVTMFAILKLTDFVKVAMATWQLRKERWLKNLTGTNGPPSGTQFPGFEGAV